MDSQKDTQQQAENHQVSIEAWRAKRHASLSRPDGWLTLVGLEWLKEGENRVGSSADNDIRLAGGVEHWGSVFVKGDELRFVSADTENVSIDGEPSAEAELVADVAGEPTLVASGKVSFYVIFRESYALRVKDSQAPALLNFEGVDNYPVDLSWRIDGRFIQAEQGTAIEISNVLGQVNEMPIFGSFEFDRDGTTHKLLAIGDAHSRDLWFIFADRTTGHGTYGAGRFLYSEGMPANGRLVVDFNKAYNPPCAFNPYSTCPLPPQENRLDLKVTAGEKDFHPHSG
ncbi:MAG: DUF1684 domain-containing protein [Xanthomonadales bacterium]|nr:DUF1684 domain-containing protein [Xanthomonadales bacterium]